MKRTRAKLAIFYLVLVFGVVATIELAAFATYLIAFQEPFSYDRLQLQRLALFPPGQANSGAQADPGPANSLGPERGASPIRGSGSEHRPAFGHSPGAARADGPRWILHPYYGFVSNPADGDEIDKFGFVGDEDQIQTADPGKIVIAMVGGSVAARLASASYFGDLLESELKNIPEFRNKKIVIVNLANGAYKQPQALISINDIISRGGHIDLLIALDGFNEIALPEAHGNLDDGISPFYPQHWRQLAESRLYPGQAAVLAKIQYLSGLRVALAAYFSKPVIRHLVVANLIWRVADGQMQAALARYRIAIDQIPPTDPASRLTNDQRAFLGPAVDYRTRRELYLDIARQWGRSSVLMNDIMAAQGGRYFHFLQPNQYVPGSKPLGEEEKKVAINPTSPYRRPVETGYPYLRAMGASLRRAGIWFDDLTDLFAGKSQELYGDDCCHPNKNGNAVLAHAIATAIAARMASGDKLRPLSVGDVDFADKLFSAQELRRFVANAADYDDGSSDSIGPAAASSRPTR